MVSVLRHVNVLHDAMEADEVELLWIRALRVARGHQGALMLTDRHVRWSGMGGLTQSQEAFPLPTLRTVRVGAARKGTTLHLEFEVDQAFTVRRADLDVFLPRLEAERSVVRLDDEVAATPALLDELERLARLRDAGALTPTEFDNAKRQLLG